MSGVPQSLPDSDGPRDFPSFSAELMINKGTHVPPQYMNHPLVVSKYFFTLPKELLEDVVEAVGESRFDSELLDLERVLSSANGDHSSCIGFRDRNPIAFNLLSSPPNVMALQHDVTAAMQNQLGYKLTPEMFAAIGTIGQRLDRDRDICRAYCGWLLLDKQFIEEHNAFIYKWAAMARRIGLDAHALATVPPEIQQSLNFRLFKAELRQFNRRWQLTSLAGPFLPNPPMRHAPLNGEPKAVLLDPTLGATFFFPSIFPLPDREELLRMIDDALPRDRLGSHLQEWQAHIATDNRTRGTTFPRFGRVFRLQHYWRIMFSRHERALDRKVAALHDIFARFLSPNSSLKDGARTIKDDLTALTASHGPDWQFKTTPLS